MPPQEPKAQAKREYAQLLRLHEQLLGQFMRAKEALLAPGTVGLVKEIKRRTGSAPDLADIKTSVEHAIRAPRDGVLERFRVAEGDLVEAGAELAELAGTGGG